MMPLSQPCGVVDPSHLQPCARHATKGEGGKGEGATMVLWLTFLIDRDGRQGIPDGTDELMKITHFGRRDDEMARPE